MKLLLLFSALLIPVIGVAQNTSFRYSFDNSVPVSANGIELKQPWAGGINAAQYNSMDLDFDGDEDLVLYDRMAAKVLTFLNIDNEYLYVPEHELSFPDAVYSWLFLRDFNCDGKKDLFTGHIFGIAVYRNISTADELKWEQVVFHEGAGQSEVILTKGLSGKVNLQIQFDDLPSISDADSDGDLDIFVMNYGGNDRIQYHKNFSMERHGTCDVPEFELYDQWWADVRECECNVFAFDKEDCDSGGRVRHAGGKSLFLFDADGDNNQDILISEAQCGVLSMLDNEGTIEAPDVQKAVSYPFNLKEEFSLYPSAHYEDVDFDGVRDFIMTPGLFSKPNFDVKLAHSNWFFRNSGTDEAPVLSLMTKSFLQEEMIDLGDNVVPAFADYDADGDLDMFLSNNDLPATITLYRNDGTPFQPKFKLESSDFLALSGYAFSNMKIQFVDINGDRKTDLVFSATKPSANYTDIHYTLNEKSGAFNFGHQAPQRLFFQLARLENISFIDIDGDGTYDLLKSRSDGALEFWKNNNKTTPSFTLSDPDYLGIGSTVGGTRLSVTSTDLNQDGRSDLILGDDSGAIRILPDFRNTADLSTVVSDVVLNRSTSQYYSANLGGRLWVTTANLYGNGQPLIVAGTSGGGVRMLRSTSEAASSPLFNAYPNPVSPALEDLRIITSDAAILEIFNVKGQRVRPSTHIPGKEITLLSLNDFSAGVYLLRFTIGNKTYMRRLVVY